MTVELPDPGKATSLQELVEALRMLKIWAADPSYETIKNRINSAWEAAGRRQGELARRATVADCFKAGRRRLNPDLVVAIVQALHPAVGYVTQWRQAIRVISGELAAASQVRVQDRLPPDLAEFTGRHAELGRLRQALRSNVQSGGMAVISTIAGMAGVGKTLLAVHAGHLLARERPWERILYVNLRGFHPDSAQPPADPAAVLEGFLRLLGVPGHEMPHDLNARTAAYRKLVAGSLTLVVLDNAAHEDQLRPLLPESATCSVLVTSRRSLAGLHPATHLTVDVFSPDEALEFLNQATQRIPVGADPQAPARIANRCGYLPLALGLVTAHIRDKSGWTLTDHADRLDERHHERRLDSAIELAFDVSYQHLSASQQRLLRLAALHPGQDLDAYAVAALCDTDLATAQTQLQSLCGDHLVQQSAPERYSLHDLIRLYATTRAGDEDSPPDRRAALTRLFDYYLANASTAMDMMYPAETHRRPAIAAAKTPVPAITGPDTARAWLDWEHLTLVAVAEYTASNGWPDYTTRLSATLHRFLYGGYPTDALTIHRQASRAAEHTGDVAGQADALNSLGVAHMWLGQLASAAEHLQRALRLFQRSRNTVGQARTQSNLGVIEERLGRFGPAVSRYQRALALYRRADDAGGQARALNNLGVVEARLGRMHLAAQHYRRALALNQVTGNRAGEADTLNNLGSTEVRMGHVESAGRHLRQALRLYRKLGHRDGEAGALDSLGTLHVRLDQPAKAAAHYGQALAMFRENDDRQGEIWALNGLGEAAHLDGRLADALAHHAAAHSLAVDTGEREQKARAHRGLGRAHQRLGNLDTAREQYQLALAHYTDLGMLQAAEIEKDLAGLE
ncbi:MAG TPA: tetratricopeptide repeat protein [Candidatus Limnocylindrales bacterium]